MTTTLKQAVLCAENPEKAVTFAVVGVASGSVLLLVFLILRVVLRNRRRAAASAKPALSQTQSGPITGGLIIGVSGTPKDSYALSRYDSAVDSSEQVGLLQSPSDVYLSSTSAAKSPASAVSIADSIIISTGE